MTFRKIFLILLLGAAAYFVVRHDDAMQIVNRGFDGFVRSSRASRTRPSDVPMIVTKIASDRGIGIDEARAIFEKTVADTRRFRLQGEVVERLPFGHVLVRGSVWKDGAIDAPNQLFALHGYPPADSLAVGAPVECTVWMVGPHLFARQDRSLMKFEEVVYTPQQPSPTTTKPKEKEPGPFDRKP